MQRFLGRNALQSTYQVELHQFLDGPEMQSVAASAPDDSEVLIILPITLVHFPFLQRFMKVRCPAFTTGTVLQQAARTAGYWLDVGFFLCVHWKEEGGGGGGGGEKCNASGTRIVQIPSNSEIPLILKPFFTGLSAQHDTELEISVQFSPSPGRNFGLLHSIFTILGSLSSRREKMPVSCLQARYASKFAPSTPFLSPPSQNAQLFLGDSHFSRLHYYQVLSRSKSTARKKDFPRMAKRMGLSERILRISFATSAYIRP